MGYKSFYYLQIPKTGSKYFIGNIYWPLAEELKKHNINLINMWDQNSKPVITGWDPRIDEDTYVVSTFRDPVRQVVSKYCNQFRTSDKPESKYYLNETPDKKEFFLHVDKYYNNMSKYLANHSTDNDKDVFQSTEINIESAVRRSKRVNKFILESTNPWQVIREILTDMDLPVPDYLYKDLFRQKVNVNNSSRLLYESLSTEEIEHILSRSDVDGPIYEYVRDYKSS